MKQQIREEVWKNVGHFGEIPHIKKIDRLIKLLEKTVAGKKVYFTEDVPEKIVKKFSPVELKSAELIISGAVAASDSGACLALDKKNFGRKHVIAVVDSTQLVKTDEYDFTADTIITPHYIIKSKKVVGIDEAGRGCVIGPLAVGGVCVKKCQLGELKALGVKDSKKLSAAKRRDLDKRIREMADVFVELISPATIDGRNGSRKNLNRLEESAFLSLIKKSSANEVYTDALGRDCERLREKLEIDLDPSYSVTCAIRADDKFPIVSAASIVAKVRRDAAIEKLQSKYGDFGSGYAHDNKTCSFLANFYRENKFFPPIVRQNWGTVDRIKGEVTQKKLFK